MAQQSSPDVDQILSTIRQVESSNNYGAQAKGSSASGAYQFIDSTWQASTKKFGLGTEYARARHEGYYERIDLINGSSFVTQTINLMFHRREGAKSRAIKILGEGQRDFAVIVLDGNGKYWYFDKVQVTAYGEGSGTAKADGSKYSLVLTAEAENLAFEVDPDVIPTII